MLTGNPSIHPRDMWEGPKILTTDTRCRKYRGISKHVPFAESTRQVGNTTRVLRANHTDNWLDQMLDVGCRASVPEVSREEAGLRCEQESAEHHR